METVNKFTATKKEPGLAVKFATSLDEALPLSLPVSTGKPPTVENLSIWLSAVIFLWGSRGGERQERVDVKRKVKRLYNKKFSQKTMMGSAGVAQW